MCNAIRRAALCHVSGNIYLLDYLARSILFVLIMGSDLMRLRTLIELLAALILTIAALVAVSKMARTTGMKVENAYAIATMGEVKTGFVYLMLNNLESEPARLCCAATHAAGIDARYSAA